MLTKYFNTVTFKLQLFNLNSKQDLSSLVFILYAYLNIIMSALLYLGEKFDFGISLNNHCLKLEILVEIDGA